MACSGGKHPEAPSIVILGTDGEPLDKYTAGIELSNRCRQFYVYRLQAAETFRQKMDLNGVCSQVVQGCKPTVGGVDCPSTDADCRVKPIKATSDPPHHPRPQTSIDLSMETLKRAMASLVDQDLVLMKQLLTLNEQIEELKWQRKFCGHSRGSLTGSSCNLDSSICTLSDGEFLDRVEEELPSKYPTPSTLSLCHELSVSNDENEDFEENLHTRTGSSTTSDLSSSGESANSVTEVGNRSKRGCTGQGGEESNPNSYRITHNEQHSFDSGIHDPDHPMADVVL